MPIDVHAHYFPPDVIAALERDSTKYGVSVVLHEPTCQKCLRFATGLQIRPFFPRLVEEAPERIDWMRSIGLSRQILSVWADVMGYGLAQSANWHRLLNDRMGEFCTRHSEAFSWMASAPLNDAHAAALELERAVKKLGAVGAVNATNVDGVNLGEVSLDEYWAAAQELDVPVFLHPTDPAPGPRARKFALAQVAQYTVDTTMCMMSLIGAGVLDRFPGLRLIASHGGGGFLFLSGRADIMHDRTDRKTSGSVAINRPSTYIRRFWYDTILHEARSLRFVTDAAGIDRMVLGTDESFTPHEADPLGALRVAGFQADELDLIAERTPRALFRLPE